MQKTRARVSHSRIDGAPGRFAVNTEAQMPEIVFRVESLMYRVGKRMLDLVLAVGLGVLVFPVCLLIMLAIKCTSPGPILYRHVRVGQRGCRFFLYKFRTMVPDSQYILDQYLAESYEARHEWTRQQKLRFDPRVTRLGKMLRRTSLDELPQIINVILGDMSFVGPRPVVPGEIARYGDAYSIYAVVKPGITGLWQVKGRGTVPYEKRILLDVEYVETWSMINDLKILISTPLVIANCEGAY